jgi:hypothetical protein
MLKNIHYVWLGLIATFLATFLGMYFISFVWSGGTIIEAIAVFLIPFFIAIWHIWKRTKEPFLALLLLLTSILTAIVSSFLISIPLTPPFRYFLNSIYGELSIIVYGFLLLANFFLLPIPVVITLNFINKLFLRQNKIVMGESGIVFFALSGLLSLLILFVLSLIFHIPNNFTWFYDLQNAKASIARYNQLPEVEVTDFKMPDNYHYLVATLNNQLITLDRTDRFSMGFTYCPDVDVPNTRQNRFVVKSTETFKMEFNEAATSLEFPLEPFEVYMQPSLNSELWMQIGGCKKSVQLPKKFFDTLTHVLVIFLEPDGETFRAYSYNRSTDSWHVKINKGSRDYLK